MKVAGVIAEYNPFHNGHKYQLDEIRKRTGADYIVVAMSGNFVQRGTPAIIDKYSRAQMALSCGADLVIEIPVIWATASAEYYGKAGVSLLAATGVMDFICFGAEDDELDKLKKYAVQLNNESDDVSRQIAELVRQGMSYPVARQIAYNAEDFVSKPNNTLAIEYLRALDSLDFDIEPVLIKRTSDNYNETAITSQAFSSATAIRESIFTGNEDWIHQVPDVSTAIINEYCRNSTLVHPDDFSNLLLYKLISEKTSGFSKYADCNDTLSGAIVKNLNHFESFAQFADLIKTKNFTHTRITRALTHILLNITDTDYENGKNTGFAPYLRILGFKKYSSELLHTIKKEASAPLITKVADASSQLSKEAYFVFEKDLFATDVYTLKPGNEFVQGPIII